MAMLILQHMAMLLVSKVVIGMNFKEFFAVVFWGNHDLSIIRFCHSPPSNIRTGKTHFFCQMVKE